MKFRFPVIIIDEDFRAENISGSGIRDLAEAIQKEGMEVVGLISYGDLTAFAQQASRASCFIISVDDEGDSRRFVFRAPEALARCIAPKGSVCLNGTSLTVNEVDGAQFGINLIPHTLSVTCWGNARAGDSVNLEIDMLARYVARLKESLNQ